ncbi:MAG: hypothetical protein E7161_00885 [Firmicutes bacterium]|nr:hypothetical protein [Bacillota bacterium]
MDKIIKNVLKKIEDAGFEAYLVGGFVRDYLLGIKSLDVDICTNALPKDLHQMFPSNSNSNTYGGFNLKIKNYNIDITTYRKELKYDKRKPTEIVYIDKLEDDIVRRDFTINSVCMNKEEKIIDLVNGIEDINNHQIRMLGNVKERFIEDPLRILRAIRFATILNFELDEEIIKEIKENYELVNTLSTTRIKQELNKILLHKNYLKGLTFLKEFNILTLLGISFNEITYVNDICGMWAQLETSKNYAFTKQEITNIINIRQIISDGNINNKKLYDYGLYVNLVAAEILNINKKHVNKLYNDLPIKSLDDLQITNNEIMELLNIKPSKILRDIKAEIVELILENKLKNRNSELKKYIINRKEM